MTKASPTKFTERLDDALSYASRMHRDQRRRGADIPCVSHLLGVAAIAIENGASEDQGGSTRLEDIRSRFGDGVAQIVADCTDSDVEP